MKKIILLALMVTAVTIIYAQEKRVALVTFYCDKKITGTGTAIAESLLKDTSYNLQPLVEKVYARFANEFAKDFPFKLIDNKDVIGQPEYKAYKSVHIVDTAKNINMIGGQYALVPGMIWAYGENQGFSRESQRDPCNLLKVFPDVDGILFVSIEYEFQTRLMGVAAGAVVFLNMFLWDKECNKVFAIREAASSKGKVPAVLGVPILNVKKIRPLCEDATNELFDDLQGRLAKIIRKSTKL